MNCVVDKISVGDGDEIIPRREAGGKRKGARASKRKRTKDLGQRLNVKRGSKAEATWRSKMLRGQKR